MTTKTKPAEVRWFARGGSVTRYGPFETQVEAARAMRFVCKFHRVPCECPPLFPADVFIWPEEVPPEQT